MRACLRTGAGQHLPGQQTLPSRSAHATAKAASRGSFTARPARTAATMSLRRSRGRRPRARRTFRNDPRQHSCSTRVGLNGAPRGYQYWRYVELDSSEVIEWDLEMLRRIDPDG